MGIPLEQIARAGFVERPGKLERINGATDVRSAAAGATGGANLHLGSAGQASELERDTGDGAVAKVQIQTAVSGRFRVVVKTYRRRLLDIDNLCEKYHIDLLRYSGVIPSDAPGVTQIEVCQEKIGSKEPERVVIEVRKL
jgi:hypothetical protein